MKSVVIRQEISPNGRFSLDVFPPDEITFCFIATLRCIDGSAGLGQMGAGFGPYPAVSPDELAIRWDLPNHVCGIYLGSCCYGLFRFGNGRRRTRGRFRAGIELPFTEEEITWFCAKTHQQFRASWEQLP
jgi:hypothetical protein